MKQKYLLIIFAILLTSCKQLEIKRINKVETIRSIFYNNQIIAKGNIIDMEENGITDYGFCYAANNSFPTINDDRISLGKTNKTGEFSANLIGLQAFNVYHFRAYAISNNVVTYGNVFGTDVVPIMFNLKIDTLKVISSKEINLIGSINGIGGLKILDFGYDYSLFSNAFAQTNKQSLGILNKDTVFSGKILNPVIDTTYYVKTYAQISDNSIFYSAEKTVRVSSIKFSTDTAVVTPLLSAKIYGLFQNLGADNIQEYGFCYASSTSFPTLNDAKLSYNNPS
ncbi:MAG: hypothetical protein ACOYMA_12720, partial [Bacteroidia bacterium]